MTYLYFATGKFSSDEFIKAAVRSFTGINGEVNVFRPKKGKPYTDCGVYFSLSHSDLCTICVVSDYEIGADVEKIRDVKTGALSKRFLGKEISDIEEFFYEWTAFESRIKYRGSSIFDENSQADGTYVSSFKYDEYIISVCLDVRETEIKKERLHI